MAAEEKSRTVSASSFKARCLKLMDEVAETGEPVLITKNGKLVAQLAPAPRAKPKRSGFGFLRDQFAELDEIDWTKPLTDPSDWEAENL